jgi:hypothetical protein
LIDWIDMGYAPEHYSQAQLDELDRLTERWVADHLRRAKLDFGRFRRREREHFPCAARYGTEFLYCLGLAGT